MTDLLTARAAAELIGYEAIVLEWYLDSAKPPVGTWGIGVTDASGHKVERYKDKPTTVERALEVYVWLLRTRYIPDVMDAFKGFPLTETQFAAALSFHYNTGRIESTDWVKLVKGGLAVEARSFLETHYTNDFTKDGINNGQLTERRAGEAKLFFDGIWSPTNGTASVFPVSKPSYRPDFRRGKRVDIRADLSVALNANPAA